MRALRTAPTVAVQVLASEHAPIAPGNCLPLGKIPVGSIVHNVEIRPGAGGQMSRAAGVYATVRRGRSFRRRRRPLQPITSHRDVHGRHSIGRPRRCLERPQKLADARRRLHTLQTE